MKTTIQEVIQSLIEPAGAIENTVDALLFGDPLAEATGIATAFMPTQRILEEASAMGANLVVAHEGPFYSHHAAFQEKLAGDPVYQTKTTFIAKSGLALFRFHDHIHRYKPDGITEGLVEALGWQDRVTEHRPEVSFVELDSPTVREVAEHVKARLALTFVRVTGDADMTCRRIGLLAGYRGGGHVAIPLFEEHNLDLILYGEGPEWETPEYVRDAAYQGRSRASIALGHAESEEAGMRRIAVRLQERFPHIPVRHLSDRPIYQII